VTGYFVVLDGRQKALEARLHAFEIQAVVLDGVQQIGELAGVAGLVLVGRDAIAEIEVLDAQMESGGSTVETIRGMMGS
jgi:hypothetical protein